MIDIINVIIIIIGYTCLYYVLFDQSKQTKSKDKYIKDLEDIIKKYNQESKP